MWKYINIYHVILPLLPVGDWIRFGRARISYIIGYWNHGTLKCKPSEYILCCIPPILLNIIPRCPPCTVGTIFQWCHLDHVHAHHSPVYMDWLIPMPNNVAPPISFRALLAPDPPEPLINLSTTCFAISFVHYINIPRAVIKYHVTLKWRRCNKVKWGYHWEVIEYIKINASSPLTLRLVFSG